MSLILRKRCGKFLPTDEDETASPCPPLYPSTRDRTAAQGDIWAISSGVSWEE